MKCVLGKVMVVNVPSERCKSMPVNATTTEVAPATGASVMLTRTAPDDSLEPPPHAANVAKTSAMPQRPTSKSQLNLYLITNPHCSQPFGERGMDQSLPVGAGAGGGPGAAD